MSRFFVDEVISENYTIKGSESNHIINSLRMKKGEMLTLCDKNSIDYDCVIEDISNGEVHVKVVKKYNCLNEPNVEVILYQALPKADKMDLIVQKSVELGVTKIVPILSSRCVSRPDAKSMSKKVERWQKIAKEAAKQSRRGVIPAVSKMLSLEEALNQSKLSEVSLIFYEGGGKNIRELVSYTEKKVKSISVFIGPEGGFEEAEVKKATNCNVKIASLGNRILRTETAAITSLAVLMFHTGNI